MLRIRSFLGDVWCRRAPKSMYFSSEPTPNGVFYKSSAYFSTKGAKQKEIKLPSHIRARDLSKKLKLDLKHMVGQVCTKQNRQFFFTNKNGQTFVFENVKQVILPFESAADLAEKVGYKVEFEDKEPKLATRVYAHAHGEIKENRVQRRPVVLVMGHVDHGKTTLLDALRGPGGPSIAASEFGGITQQINISTVSLLQSETVARSNTSTADASVVDEERGQEHASALNTVEPPTSAVPPTSLIPPTNSVPPSTPVPCTASSSTLLDLTSSITPTSTPPTLNPPLPPLPPATVLDSPGHEQFARMRSTCALVGDVALLVVALDQGCGKQTEESVGWIEEQGIPAILCLNKLDLAPKLPAGRVQELERQMRSFIHLRRAPVHVVSAKCGTNVEQLRRRLAEEVSALPLWVPADCHPQGTVVEVLMERGQGLTLQVLLHRGTLTVGQWFLCGLVVARVKSIADETGQKLDEGLPGMVVRVSSGVRNKVHDAPLAQEFFVMDKGAAEDIQQWRLTCLDYENSQIIQEDEHLEDSEADDELVRQVHDGPSSQAGLEDTYNVLTTAESVLEQECTDGVEFGEEETELADSACEHLDVHQHESDPGGKESAFYDEPFAKLIVKSDSAGGLTTVLDAVEEMRGVKVIRYGIGNVSTTDVEIASTGRCSIFGFRVKMDKKVSALADRRNVEVNLGKHVPQLLDAIQEVARLSARRATNSDVSGEMYREF